MIVVRTVTLNDASAWLALRTELWPTSAEAEHRQDIDKFLSGSAREPQAVLVAEEAGRLVGFAELSTRSYAEGCDTNRVAYLEGWYVAPSARRRGIARRLVKAAEEWATSNGCSEFASDTPIDNAVSAIAHAACGFSEVGVIRCFKKDLIRE